MCGYSILWNHGFHLILVIIDYGYWSNPLQCEVSTVLALILKVNDQPSRFQVPSVLSAQVVDIPSRKLEITSLGRQLHYVVQSDTGFYFQLVFNQDSTKAQFLKKILRDSD